MSLERDMVVRSFAIFENRHLPEPEARRMCRHLGSKQELVAHIVLKRNALSRHVDIARELSRVAEEDYSEALALKTGQAQLSRVNECSLELRNSLAALLAADRSQQDVARRVCDAFSGLARQGCDGFPDLGMHWWIGSEKGK